MNVNLSSLDRRKFLRGAGVALALPLMETFARAASKPARRKRLACFYLPDGVPMPLERIPRLKTGAGFRMVVVRISSSPSAWRRSRRCAMS